MGGTYKARGINLKSVPLGESDRLLTILTREFGLIRAVAPGARKHKSSLRGRSNLFVINDLLLVKGRSLDKVVQADSLESFPTMGQDLGKLTAGQYLAELVLCQALTDHPQEDLFSLLCEHLARLNQRPPTQTLISLVQATYHLLAYGGLTPQVFQCCLTRQAIIPNQADPDWRVTFDAASGGLITQQQQSSDPNSSLFFDDSNAENRIASKALDAQTSQTRSQEQLTSLSHQPSSLYSNRGAQNVKPTSKEAVRRSFSKTNMMGFERVAECSASFNSSSETIGSRYRSRSIPRQCKEGCIELNAEEVIALQQLAQTDVLNDVLNSDARAFDSGQIDLGQGDRPMPFPQQNSSQIGESLIPTVNLKQTIAPQTWLSIERVLRHYAQYHLDQPIRSAALIETCFLTPS